MALPRRNLLLAGGAGAVVIAGGAALLWRDGESPAGLAGEPSAAPAPAPTPGAAETPDAVVEGPPPATAPVGAPDPLLRAAGRADARVVVQEFFSLTCGHCAAFHNNVWPRVRAELVETGRIRLIWRDFPLDQVALQAAMVARSLPAERYEPFLSTLFQTQERWAFAPGRQVEELARLAALAGMDRARFDAVIADQALARGVLEARLAAEREHQIRATPSFLFGTRLHSGGLSFEQFSQQVEQAARA